MQQMIAELIPALTNVSPITLAGVGVVGVGLVMFLLTRMPEFLLVIFVALAYSTTPLLSQMM